MILSKKENTIVRLRLLGFSRNEIATQLFRSDGTVKNHLRHVYEKTNVTNDISLMHWYAENELKINLRKLLE